MNVDVSLFPIKSFYYKCKFIDHEKIKPLLLKDISDFKTEEYHHHPTISKVDWMSSTKDREWVKTIYEPILSYMTVIGHAAGYKTPMITDMWFQQYKKSDTHDWHIHGQQFVGVYYVELNQDSPKTEYIEYPGDIKTFNICEGDIVVFPSSIIHRAPLINDDNVKTIISWNFNFNKPTI